LVVRRRNICDTRAIRRDRDLTDLSEIIVRLKRGWCHTRTTKPTPLAVRRAAANSDYPIDELIRYALLFSGMSTPSLDELASVAETAARSGGTYLREQFRNGAVDAEFGTDDVKARADREAESRVCTVIEEAFPTHAIHGEEFGLNGAESEYLWVVDPLDGTNNFASGIPMFATAVAVVHDGEPVVSVIYEPLTESLYTAIKGHGATYNGEPFTASSALPIEHATVSFVLGIDAVRDASLTHTAELLETEFRSSCKRVLQSWAPCVDWGLVSRGSIDGIVCFYPDIYEQHAGALLAAEAGIHATTNEQWYVGAAEKSVHDTLLELTTRVL